MVKITIALYCVNAGGGFNNVLVIGADALSRYVDWTDRGTCILFGDAAGAVLLQVIVYLRGIFESCGKCQLEIWILFLGYYT